MEGKPTWGEALGRTYRTNPHGAFDSVGAGRWEELRPQQEDDRMESFAALCRGLLILQLAREAVKESLAFWTQTYRPGTGQVAGTISLSLQVYHSICRRVQDVTELSPASNGEKNKDCDPLQPGTPGWFCLTRCGGGTHEFRGTPAAG